MSSIIEIFKSKEHNNVIHFIDNSLEIFNYIDYVFLNPNQTNLDNLNKLYKILNSYNSIALDKLKDTNNKTIIDKYKDYVCNDNDELLKIHINNFIKSRSFLNNIINVFNRNTKQHVKVIPNIEEIVNRLEELEKTVNELKVRIADKNLLTERTTT
jgi:hypothetical protein